jgi:hypothetical protein
LAKRLVCRLWNDVIVSAHFTEITAQQVLTPWRVCVCDVRMCAVLSLAAVVWLTRVCVCVCGVVCVAVLLRRQPNTTKSQTIRLLKYKGGLYVTLPATKRNVSTYKAHTHTLSLSLSGAGVRRVVAAISLRCVRVPCAVRAVCVCEQLPRRERAPMADIVTRWFAIRFNPEDFTVNTGDYTFAK